MPPHSSIIHGLASSIQTYQFGDTQLQLWVPNHPNDLLDAMQEEDFGPEERMPYWAALWPSALGLAQEMATNPPSNGAKVLELGCGLGLNGVLAARLGAEVHVCDWYDDAVAFALENAAMNNVAVQGRWMDWNHPPQDAQYDWVLGADILYEQRNHAPILAALEALLKPNGQALLSDPGRTHLPHFITMAKTQGWTLEESLQGKVHVLRLRRNP